MFTCVCLMNRTGRQYVSSVCFNYVCVWAIFSRHTNCGKRSFNFLIGFYSTSFEKRQSKLFFFLINIWLGFRYNLPEWLSMNGFLGSRSILRHICRKVLGKEAIFIDLHWKAIELLHVEMLHCLMAIYLYEKLWKWLV